MSDLTLAQSAERMRSRWDTDRYPKLVYVETTNHCNATCTFCVYDRMERPRQTMDMDTFRRVVAKVKDGGLQIGAMFCFGEPLMDTELLAKIRYARDQGVTTKYLGLNTNASMLTPDRYADLMDVTSNVTLSFPNTGEEFERLTGLSWERCYGNALAFIAYRNKHRPKFSIEIGCNDVKGHDRERVKLAFANQRVGWARDAEIQWGGKIITGVIDRSIMYHHWSCDGHKGAVQIKPNGDCCFCAYDVIRNETAFANVLTHSWVDIEQRFKARWREPSSLCLRCDFWWNYHQMVANGWARGPHIDSSWQTAYQDVAGRWDERHATNEKRWLANSGLKQIEEFLAFRAAGHVLEIGVGTGQCTRQLVERGCTVDALDVSPVALEKLKPVIGHGYTNPLELPVGRYDLAVCHLVVQHMADVDVYPLLRGVLASLAPNGRLVVQFASPPRPRLYSETLDEQLAGTVQRTPAHFERLVVAVGGRVVVRVPLVSFKPDKATDNNQWNGFHVVRT